MTADILGRFSGGPISGALLNGLATFPAAAATLFSNPVKGTLTSNGTGQFVNGVATVTPTFNSNAAGTGHADVVADSQTTTANITINPGTVALGVTSSQNPSITSQIVTLTATVTPQAPSAAFTPVGTVQFRDGGVALGAPATLSNANPAVATLNFAFSTAGNHTITADFASTDGNFNANNGTTMAGNPQSVSATAVWSGATDTTWNTGTNWTTNGAPTSVNDVSIPVGALTNEPNIPTGGTDVTITNLTIGRGSHLDA